MHQLGQTRSARHATHLIQTPDAFVRAALPGMHKATAIVHVSRAAGAAFTQYTAELEPDGLLPPAADQRFVYVLEGELDVDGDRLRAGDYGYLSPGADSPVTAVKPSRAAVIEKPYRSLEGVATPSRFVAREREAMPTHLGDDPWLEVRGLVPDNRAFDFRVNTMTYQPGASLPAVEMHVMEHGLLMLEGAGIYRLADCWYPVAAGDFIWMAPYCPQWFGAIGKAAAKYLIYKDWDRHPR